MLKIYSLSLLIFLFLCLRLFKLPLSVNYSADQGLILNETYKIYKEKKITLIGPSSSLRSKIQHEFYYGPLTYYLLLPAVIFGKEPIFASYYLIFFNAVGLIFLYKALLKRFDLKTAFFAGLFFATYPPLITHTRFVWNPNFLPFFASVVLFCWPRRIGGATKDGRATPHKCGAARTSFLFLILGLFLGFCLQLHYQSILLIALSIIWFIASKVKILNLFSTFFGFLIGFSPLIIFELRHNFYNSRTILLVFKSGTDKIIGNFNFYYLLVLTPFLVTLVGILFSKLLNFNRILGIFLISVYLIWVAKEVYYFTQQAPGMPDGWNYLGQKKAITIIVAEDKRNYNIVNLLSGDTRAQDMRYWLTIKNKPPLGIIEYPQAEWLFVVSRYDSERTKKDPVWEISSFAPSEIVKQWTVQNEINLYLFEKIKN